MPILPAWAVHLEEDLIRRSIFSTTAIEGNPLKEEEVGKIIEQADYEQKDGEAKKAIINLKKAYDYVKKNIEPKAGIYKLTEGFIKDSHRLITIELSYKDNIPA
ncbi:MAG: hypothetical protein MIO92_14880, partial [Methanosarcinaceae archaeon]|nr:hypothetical protein [Methanosarcinaceae archaeon]